ncbi:MAG TPA: homoserine O-succinyltransferase [Solirubrobacteraceae bacterium]|jgi:homoserine O-succinyltransferase|nr:homoserine O-succinyltransferase [Solirubrobacteraceae bacterium]
MVVELITRPRRIQRPLTVALVNNMPDGAFTDTEDQFHRLVFGAGPDVNLELYTFTGTPRCENVAAIIDARYRGLGELWHRPPDALIVTGTEPKQADMRHEPYWPHLARLLEWAAEFVPTVLLSCLSSHASVLLFDGIERRRRQIKCSGVFPGRILDPDDPLAIGLPEHLMVPHSRLNEVPQSALVEAGYRVVVGDAGAGVDWSVAARERGRSLFVLCQGHPEYDTLSLLREYRRDVRRYLLSKGGYGYPHLPDGYLSAAATSQLEDFAVLATAGRHDPKHLWSVFPYRQVADTVQNTWRPGSMTLYANWLSLARAASAAVA